MKPVTIGGFTGNEMDGPRGENFIQQCANRWVAAGHQLPSKDPNARSPQEQELWSAFSRELVRDADRCLAAKWHNRMVPLAAAELAAKETAERALLEVTKRWDALETAQAWHAAHHRYVLAVNAARKAIETWISVAAERDKAQTEPAHRPPWPTQVPEGVAWEDYKASVPEHERIPPSGSDRAMLTLTQLNEQHRERQAIAAETLRRPGGDL